MALLHSASRPRHTTTTSLSVRTSGSLPQSAPKSQRRVRIRLLTTAPPPPSEVPPASNKAGEIRSRAPLSLRRLCATVLSHHQPPRTLVETKSSSSPPFHTPRRYSSPTTSTLQAPWMTLPRATGPLTLDSDSQYHHVRLRGSRGASEPAVLASEPAHTTMHDPAAAPPPSRHPNHPQAHNHHTFEVWPEAPVVSPPGRSH